MRFVKGRIARPAQRSSRSVRFMVGRLISRPPRFFFAAPSTLSRRRRGGATLLLQARHRGVPGTRLLTDTDIDTAAACVLDFNYMVFVTVP
jgi:hypothetical protein